MTGIYTVSEDGSLEDYHTCFLRVDDYETGYFSTDYYRSLEDAKKDYKKWFIKGYRVSLHQIPPRSA